MNAEVDGGEQTIVHENDVAAMCIGNDNLFLRIEVGDVAVDDETLPAG